MGFRTLPRLAACVLLGAFGMHATAVADTVLITGANSGLGLEFTKQYAAKGWTVIATHRRADTPQSLAEVTAKHGNVRVERMDVIEVIARATLEDTGRFIQYDGTPAPW